MTIKGTAVKDGHKYSDENVTTEVDANGNITIKLDKALTADTVMVNGKDGKDGQIGLNGKNGTDGTVTTIIRTVGKMVPMALMGNLASTVPMALPVLSIRMEKTGNRVLRPIP